MTISKFSSPVFLKDDIDNILNNTEGLSSRVITALQDVSNDLESMQEVIRVIAKWEQGDYSDQALISAWNIYSGNRGKVRYKD